jgi:hypothetical protein
MFRCTLDKVHCEKLDWMSFAAQYGRDNSKFFDRSRLPVAFICWAASRTSAEAETWLRHSEFIGSYTNEIGGATSELPYNPAQIL